MTTDPLTATASFNLWDEPWITVLEKHDPPRPHGDDRRTLSIRDVLLEAHTLKALIEPSPLAVCGIHRLLAAILQAIYDPQELFDLVDVLKRGQFDRARIAEFGELHHARFDLFDAAAPFMQTGDVALDAWRKPAKGAPKTTATKIDAKSIAYLLPEVPTGTNRTHFHHVADDMHRFCPACCARGLVTIPAFATSGGAGIKPSINGVPPVYILPVGETLFHALACSIVAPEYRPAVRDDRRTHAAWEGPTTVKRNDEVNEVGYLESLTFAARRVRLFPLLDEGHCTQCGQWSAVRVKDMLFEMGVSRQKDLALWKDPFVAYRVPKGASTPLPLRPTQGKALWRDYGTLFLTEGELQPSVVRQMVDLMEEHALSREQRLRFRCIGMKTDGKAKVFEWLDDALAVPPVALQTDLGVALIRQALDRAELVIRRTSKVFFDHAKANPKANQERFATLRSRMEDAYWTALATPFGRDVIAAIDTEDIDTIDERWGRLIIKEAARVFDEAVDQLGEAGDMLRRQAYARNSFGKALAEYRKEWNLVKQHQG